MSADPEKEIHALIDQAKSGAPSQIPSEVQAALPLIPEAKNANFFGTYNYVRAIQMALAFVPMPVPAPQVEVQSQSNIAFAGDIGNGRLLIDIAVPKQQVLEIKEIITQMQQKMQPQQKPSAPPGARPPGQT
jgi:hypothetical protein